MDLDAVEVRVLGCLIEKQRTTPDAYPLSLNALRLACNQSTNRDPVVDYDDHTVRDALDRPPARGRGRGGAARAGRGGGPGGGGGGPPPRAPPPDAGGGGRGGGGGGGVSP